MGGGTGRGTETRFSIWNVSTLPLLSMPASQDMSELWFPPHLETYKNEVWGERKPVETVPFNNWRTGKQVSNTPSLPPTIWKPLEAPSTRQEVFQFL